MGRLLLALALAACLGLANARGGARQLLQAAPGPAEQPPLAAAAPPAPPAGPSAAAASGACGARLAGIGFSSNLPVVVLDTGGRPLDTKDVDVPLRSLCTCSPPGLGIQDYEGLGTAWVRGTTSANTTKKSFGLELQERRQAGAAAAGAAGTAGAAGAAASQLKSRKFPWLGMPKDADWILYGGDEVDLTQGLRNWLTYNLYRQGTGRYASRTVYCEVFLVDDGAAALAPSHYHGVYIGLEKLELAPHRVNATEVQPPNLSGGYLLSYENDNLGAGDVRVGPLQGWEHPFVLKDPKKAPAEARAWLASYLQRFQDELEAPDWLSRTPGYPALIDGPAWADYFLLTELTKNPDGYRGSIYMYKGRDAPLAAGPPWDYNEAYGICCGYPIEGWDRQGESGPGQAGGSAISPEGWRFLICADPERCQIDPSDGISRWYRRMWQDPRFHSAAAARWAQLRAGPWSDAAIDGMLASIAEQIRPAVLRNFQRYRAVLAKPWHTDQEGGWSAEVATLQGWLAKHLAWMDAALAAAAASGDGAPAPAGR